MYIKFLVTILTAHINYLHMSGHTKDKGNPQKMDLIHALYLNECAYFLCFSCVLFLLSTLVHLCFFQFLQVASNRPHSLFLSAKFLFDIVVVSWQVLGMELIFSLSLFIPFITLWFYISVCQLGLFCFCHFLFWFCFFCAISYAPPFVFRYIFMLRLQLSGAAAAERAASCQFFATNTAPRTSGDDDDTNMYLSILFVLATRRMGGEKNEEFNFLSILRLHTHINMNTYIHLQTNIGRYNRVGRSHRLR